MIAAESLRSGVLASARQRLFELLEESRHVARILEATSVESTLAGLAAKLEQDQFYFAVVGQFKRGKSSLLNALIGADVLPAGLLPLTSVVTLLRYGQRPRALVVYRSGVREEVAIAALGEFVTERENPKNRKGVAYVEVEYPAPLLRLGATLVDTPGIASIHTHNTGAAYDFLPKVDAAVFVTSPESPLTQAESQYLKDLLAETPRVFVVLNKSDTISAAERDELQAFVRSHLPDGLRQDGLLFAVSARMALEARRAGDDAALERSGLPGLEAALRDFIKQRRDETLLAATVRRLQAQLSQMRMRIELEKRAVELPQAELTSRVTKLEKALRAAEAQRDDNDALLDRAVARMAGRIEEEARAFAASQAAPLIEKLEGVLEANRSLGKRRLAELLDRELRAEVTRRIDGWRERFEGPAREEFQAAVEKFRARVNELISQVRSSAAEAFGFDVGPLEAPEDLAELEPSGYFTDPLLDWGLGSAPLLLPGRVYRRWLASTLRRRAPLELDRNATRVVFDFRRRLSTSAEDFRRRLNGHLELTVDGIRRGLASAAARHRAGAEEGTARLAQLEELRQTVERLATDARQLAAGA